MKTVKNVLALMFLLFSLALPTFAAGSFFDTIQSANENAAVNESPEISFAITNSAITTTVATVTPTAVKVMSPGVTVRIGLPAPTILDRLSQMTGAQVIDAINTYFNIKILGGLLGQGRVEDGFLWVKDQLVAVFKALYTLPKLFVCPTKEIMRAKDYFGANWVLGWVNNSKPRVYLTNAANIPSYFTPTLVHEMAHLYFFSSVNTAVATKFKATFYKPSGKTIAINTKIDGSSVSSYGNTNVNEDFAESVRLYWENGPVMKARFPARYAFIKDNVFGGVEYLKRQGF